MFGHVRQSPPVPTDVCYTGEKRVWLIGFLIYTGFVFQMIVSQTYIENGLISLRCVPHQGLRLYKVCLCPGNLAVIPYNSQATAFYLTRNALEALQACNTSAS